MVPACRARVTLKRVVRVQSAPGDLPVIVFLDTETRCGLSIWQMVAVNPERKDIQVMLFQVEGLQGNRARVVFA